MPWQIESFFCFLFLQQDSRIRRNHHGPFCPFGPLPSQDDLQADNDDYRLPCPYGKYDSIQGQLFGHRHMILCCRHKLQSHLFRRIFLQFFHKNDKAFEPPQKIKVGVGSPRFLTQVSKEEGSLVQRRFSSEAERRPQQPARVMLNAENREGG